MKSTTLISSMKVSLVSLFVISSVLLTSNSAFAVGAVPVITRTGSATVNIEYGDTYTDAGATASDVEDGNLTGSIITTGTVNNMVLGTYTIQYNVTDSDTNAAVTVTRTVNVVQKVLTVTGITASNKDYDGTTSATLNTGGAALVGVVGAEDVTLNLGGATGTFANKNVGNGKTVTVAGLTLGGTATLTNYSLTQPTTTANITTRAITVTAAANDRPYTGLTTATGTPTLTAGTLGTGDTATYTQSYDTATVGTGKTLTPVAVIRDAGLVDVTANYAITYVNDTNGVITQAPLTITADAKTRVYGDANPALTVSYSGFVNSETSAVLSTPVTVTTAASSTSNVGTVSIVPSAAVATNYAISFVNGNLTITARPLTVTADAQTKVYGNADPAFTYVSSGLVNGDTLSGTLSRVAGTNVGTYGITQGSLTAGGNYTISYVGANLTVTTRAITVTAAANDRPYTGLTTATGTPTVTSGTLASGDTANFSQVYDTATVGTGKTLTPSGTVTDGNSGNNYTYTFVPVSTGVITQAPLTITADAKTRVYGDANPALTVSYSGFVNSETSAVLSTPVTVTTAASSTSNVGTVSIVPSAAVATNYAISFVNGNLTITARPLTVTADAQTKVYGAVDPTFTQSITLGNLVNGDTLSGSLTRATGTSIGTYAINQGTLTAGTNYTITYVPANLTITAKPITVTANPITKERLAVDPTLTYTGTSSLEVGDSFTGALTRAAGETTGVYAITQGTLTAGTNYTITFTGANFTIVDTTAPTLTSVSIASNNASTTLAKVGDTITLTFSASEAINAPTVTIAGQAAVTTGTTTGPYTATYVLQSTDTTGTVPFTVNFSDIASNAGTQVSSTTNASSVRFDKTPPTATIVMGSSLLTFNQTTSVTITFSEKVMGFDATDVSTPSGTLSALTTNDGGITFTGTYTPGGSVLALSNVMVVSTGYTDLAGNAPVATASTANYVVNTLVTSAGGGFGGNTNNNAQANAPTTPATNANGQVLGAAATNIVSDLRPGRRGEEVSNLQKMLINQGFMNGTPTGFFGVATRAAVAKWQAKNGLPATGFFGPLSRAFLNRTNQ